LKNSIVTKQWIGKFASACTAAATLAGKGVCFYRLPYHAPV
jgi:hypothetical protein